MWSGSTGLRLSASVSDQNKRVLKIARVAFFVYTRMVASIVNMHEKHHHIPSSSSGTREKTSTPPPCFFCCWGFAPHAPFVSFSLLLFSLLAESNSPIGLLALVFLLWKVSLFLMSSASAVLSLRRSTTDLLVFLSLHYRLPLSSPRAFTC